LIGKVESGEIVESWRRMMARQNEGRSLPSGGDDNSIMQSPI
jgi:hypothetical protein